MKGVSKQRWSDEDVLNWADLFIDTFKPLVTLEKELGVSHSTIWWNFMHRLEYLDQSKYEDVCILLDLHKGQGGRPSKGGKK